MGIIRLLFALSVLIFHAGQFFGYNITNRTVSVMSFFIISGFYMALILDKKYIQKHHLFLFWSNRALKIFPLYWVTLALTFAFTYVKYALHIGADDNAIVHYIHWASQTSPLLFGVDLVNYILRNITLIISLDYFRLNDSTPGYLLILQAWSLQIELLFYLLVPFLIKLSKKLFLLIFAMYCIGLYCIVKPLHLIHLNLFFEFYNYLIYFFLGIISYRFLYTHKALKKTSQTMLKSVFVFLLMYLFLYNFMPTAFDPLYYLTFTCCLPFIFLMTKNSNLDAFIGKLSYPVYLLHFFVIKLVTNIPQFHTDSNGKTILIIVLTLGLGYLAVKYIDDPIDRYRQARVKLTKKH